MKRLIAFLTLAVFTALFAAPCSATETPRTSTEAVFYAQGAIDTNAETALALPAQRSSFRTMAGVNRNNAGVFLAFAALTSDPAQAAANRIIGFYFLGRADAFDLLADLEG
jgi:hypothetical protein